MNAPAAALPANDDGLWLKSLKADVQPMTFKKGRQYAEARRVSGLARTDVGIAAKVAGSDGEKYDVQVAPLDDGKIESLCNCESWNKYGPHCKHVVAAALVYLARVKARAEAEPVVAAVAASTGADAELIAADPVSLPALAKLENWLGLSALPDLEFQYRLTPTNAQTGGRVWVVDVRRLDQHRRPLALGRHDRLGEASVAPANRHGDGRATRLRLGKRLPLALRLPQRASPVLAEA